MPTSSKSGKRTSTRSSDVRSDDQLDQLIHEGGLRITDVEPLPHQGLLVVMLNSGSPLMVRTSLFPRLAKAKAEQLNAWEVIAGGTAIGWASLDEHLSLKGFLLTEVRNEVMDRLRAQLAQQLSPSKVAGRRPATRSTAAKRKAVPGR